MMGVFAFSDFSFAFLSLWYSLYQEFSFPVLFLSWLLNLIPQLEVFPQLFYCINECLML